MKQNQPTASVCEFLGGRADGLRMIVANKHDVITIDGTTYTRSGKDTFNKEKLVKKRGTDPKNHVLYKEPQEKKSTLNKLADKLWSMHGGL